MVEEKCNKNEKHDKEIEKEEKEREDNKICCSKAFNMWVLKELWKKYNGTYAGFYENICTEPTYRRIMKYEITRENETAAKKNTGIPKEYLNGEKELVITSDSDMQVKIGDYNAIKWIKVTIEKFYRKWNSIEILEDEEKKKSIEKEKADELDVILDKILIELNIEDEYDDLVAAMENIKSEFLSKYKKHKNEKMKGTYNDYLANMIDVVAGRKEEITVKLRVHDIEELKNKVSECVNTIIEMCEEAENLESDIMEILNRLDIENVQKNSDMYKILYFMKYKKKYD